MDPQEFGAGTALGLHNNQAQEVSRRKIMQKMGSGDAAWALSDSRAVHSKSAAAFSSNLLCAVWGLNQSNEERCCKLVVAAVQQCPAQQSCARLSLPHAWQLFRDCVCDKQCWEVSACPLSPTAPQKQLHFAGLLAQGLVWF